MNTTKQKIVFVIELIAVSVLLGIGGYYLGTWIRETFPDIAEAFQNCFGK